ncbi:MAG TPA: type II toxin-antitoxin system VapC family toxin [Reyranella sp.]|nr:type II toxin-antitoxin system VapC family toxin [Reyranella sp.]
MPFVLDASVSACWAFDDEDHPTAALALERLRTDEAHAPTLWWYEMRNIVVINERRGRLTREDATAFLRSLVELGISDHHAPDEQTVLFTARTQGLTVYDASYLALAQQLALPLATLDAQLMRAAQAVQVPLFQ